MRVSGSAHSLRGVPRRGGGAAARRALAPVHARWFEPSSRRSCGRTAVLAADGYGIADHTAIVLEGIVHACTAFFVELVAKVAAVRWDGYWADGWNRFDFLLVSGALLGTAIDAYVALVALLAPSNHVHFLLLRTLRFLRLLRLLRSVRAVQSSRGLRAMPGTLGHSLPQLANVGRVRPRPVDLRRAGDAALWRRRPRRLPYGRLLLVFGGVWRAVPRVDGRGLERDYARLHVSDESGGCSEAEGNCGSWLAVPFFVSYIVVTAFVVLNMMIALILHTYAQQKRPEAMAVTPAHETFQRAWAPHDPLATGRMPLERVRLVVHDCPPPLGLEPRPHAHGYIKMADVTRYVRRLGLKVYPPLPGEAGLPSSSTIPSRLLRAAHANEIAHRRRRRRGRVGRRRRPSTPSTRSPSRTRAGSRERA